MSLRDGIPVPDFAPVARFDAAFDRLLDTVRGPAADHLFFGLSSAADHGLLWNAVAGTKAALTGRPVYAARFAAAMGVESALTNGPVKMMFRRVRPDHEHPDDMPWGMRVPITSSFPSGHATSGFMAATMLAGGPMTPVWFGLAGLVATSRVYVKMHHASDVVAGAAFGIGLGLLARRFVGR